MQTRHCNYYDSDWQRLDSLTQIFERSSAAKWNEVKWSGGNTWQLKNNWWTCAHCVQPSATWEEVFSYYDVLLLLLVLFCCLHSFQNLFVAFLVTQRQLWSHTKKVLMVSHILINSQLVGKVRYVKTLVSSILVS